jgi:hypothetical protein
VNLFLTLFLKKSGKQGFLMKFFSSEECWAGRCRGTKVLFHLDQRIRDVASEIKQRKICLTLILPRKPVYGSHYFGVKTVFLNFCIQIHLFLPNWLTTIFALVLILKLQKPWKCDLFYPTKGSEKNAHF